MMQHQGRMATIFGLTIIAAGIGGLVLFLSMSNSSAEERNEAILLQAIKLYEDKRYDESLELIDQQSEEMLNLDEGCELVISVLVRYPKRLEDVEKIATQCLAIGKATGIAHEALAMSLLHLGRSDEALQRLVPLAATLANDRIYGALANLYMARKDFVQAGKAFLEAMRISEIWSVWLSRALRFDRVTEHKEFIMAAAAFVLKQEKHIASVEMRLEKKLIALGEQEAAAQLAKRRTTIGG